MESSSYYLFSSKFSKKPITVLTETITFDQACNLVRGITQGLNFPLYFQVDSGKEWTDILNPSDVSLYLVSDRFITLFNENQIYGWNTFPVKIMDKKGTEIPGYHGLSIFGESGPIDYSKSGKIEKAFVPNGKVAKFFKGFTFELDCEKGYDIFIPKNTLNIIVNRKVRDLIINNHISNLFLENTKDVETPEFGILNT